MHSELKRLSTIFGISISLLGSQLHCDEASPATMEQFSFANMDEEQQQTTGVYKLSDEEKKALEDWTKNWSSQHNENKQNTPNQNENQSKDLLTREEAENLIIALEDGQETQKPANTTFSIKAIREDGKFIDLDNNTTYKVPSLLRRKTAKWSAGAIIEIQTTKKPQWVRLVNSTTHEHVLAKIETPENQPQPQNMKTDGMKAQNSDED
jgi:hypothetical protein